MITPRTISAVVCSRSQGRVPSDQVAYRVCPARLLLTAWTPKAVGINLAKIRRAGGKTEIGIIMPAKAMITILPTWLMAPMLGTHMVSAVMIKP